VLELVGACWDMQREQILNSSFSFSTINFINNIIKSNSRTIRYLFYHDVIIDVLIVIANLLIVVSISWLCYCQRCYHCFYYYYRYY